MEKIWLVFAINSQKEERVTKREKIMKILWNKHLKMGNEWPESRKTLPILGNKHQKKENE